MDKVSVIIPTYNCLSYLPKSIGSILEQDHDDFEIILVDDNSCDGTGEFLQKWRQAEPRIRVITTSGVGASQARNLGIEQANGKYIAFLDADDFWCKNKLSTQVQLHKQHPELALSFTNYNHLTEDYDVIVDCFRYWAQFQGRDDDYIVLDKPLDFILANNIIGTSTVMIRASFLDKSHLFDPTLTYCEDWELWLRLCESHPIAAINSIQTGYLMRPGSITKTDSKRLEHLACIDSILEKYQQHESSISSKSLRIAKSRLLEGYADYHRGLNEYLYAIRFGLASMFTYPQMRKIRSILGDCKRTVLPQQR